MHQWRIIFRIWILKITDSLFWKDMVDFQPLSGQYSAMTNRNISQHMIYVLFDIPVLLNSGKGDL